MTTPDAVLRDYMDALLRDPAPTASVAPEPAGAAWQACTLGRLHVLLPGDALGAPVAARALDRAPAAWHLATIPIDGGDRRVAELARCIAPDLPAVAIDMLLPVNGTPWLLGVPGVPAAVSVADDAIAWRAQRASRPWLAGMTRDARCMVLDVHALIAQLPATPAATPP